MNSCLDNIKPARSTIKQAGMGAFATRRIKKGEVVIPMPVLHLPRSHMGVYDSEDYEDPEKPVRYLGEQLYVVSMTSLRAL